MEPYAISYPLHFYAKKGNLDGIKLLGEEMNDTQWKNIIDPRDNRGMTMLQCAMEGGNLELVKYLVSKGADIHSICTGDDPKGWAVMHFAAFDNRAEIIKYLFSIGADINQCDGNAFMFTPLKVAITRGHEESALLLLELGANFDTVDEMGYTLLHEAVNMELVNVVKELIKKGADPGAEAKNGSTPFFWAMMKGNKKIIKLLEKYL